MITACKDGKRPVCNYVCPNCVTVSQDLLTLVPPSGSQSSLIVAAQLTKLKETIKENEKTIKEKDKTIKKLQTTQQHLLDMVETQKEDLSKIKNKISDENQLLETVENQKAELTELKKKLSNDPGFHTVEYVEEKLEKKFEEFQSSIISTIKEECNKTYAAAVSSESTVTKETENIKSMMKDVRKEEVAEEKDKERRSKNILIHGAIEPTEDQPTKDDEWVKKLIQNLRVKVNMKHMVRIGAKAEGKHRPILVTLKDEREKETIFGNLHTLKGNDDYKGVSICEDLTPEERKVFKDLAAEARAKNTEETEGIWRVRGSSKNGFRLKLVKTTKLRQQ